MKKEISQHFPLALKAVEEHLLKDTTKKIAWEEYDGHAASLGPSIRISGLIPALAFYTDVSREGNDRKRNPILMSIYDILRPDAPGTTAPRSLLDAVLKDVYPDDNVRENANSALQASVPDTKKRDEWKTEIICASIALKLALRTFIHSDQKMAKDES